MATVSERPHWACWTPQYAPPEAYTITADAVTDVVAAAGPAFDVWSIGVSAAEMVLGDILYVQTEEERAAEGPDGRDWDEVVDATARRIAGDVGRHARHPLWPSVRPEVQEFISMALRHDPRERATIQQLKDSAWGREMMVATGSHPITAAPAQAAAAAATDGSQDGSQGDGGGEYAHSAMIMGLLSDHLDAAVEADLRWKAAEAMRAAGSGSESGGSSISSLICISPVNYSRSSSTSSSPNLAFYSFLNPSPPPSYSPTSDRGSISSISGLIGISPVGSSPNLEFFEFLSPSPPPSLPPTSHAAGATAAAGCKAGGGGDEAAELRTALGRARDELAAAEERGLEQQLRILELQGDLEVKQLRFECERDDHNILRAAHTRQRRELAALQDWAIEERELAHEQHRQSAERLRQQLEAQQQQIDALMQWRAADEEQRQVERAAAAEETKMLQQQINALLAWRAVDDEQRQRERMAAAEGRQALREVQRFVKATAWQLRMEDALDALQDKYQQQLAGSGGGRRGAKAVAGARVSVDDAGAGGVMTEQDYSCATGEGGKGWGSRVSVGRPPCFTLSSFPPCSAPNKHLVSPHGKHTKPGAESQDGWAPTGTDDDEADSLPTVGSTPGHLVGAPSTALTIADSISGSNISSNDSGSGNIIDGVDLVVAVIEVGGGAPQPKGGSKGMRGGGRRSQARRFKGAAHKFEKEVKALKTKLAAAVCLPGAGQGLRSLY